MGTDPIDLTGLRTVSLYDRKSKVTHTDFGSPWSAGGAFRAFLDSLPRILAADDLLDVADRIAAAHRHQKQVLLGMGAHPVKVGLSPVIVDLMRREIITGVAMNGAGIIHDTEVALAGRTSEDVEAALGTGNFGMARETADLLNEAVTHASENNLGLGAGVGRVIRRRELPFGHLSILSEGVRLGIPVTVHVAIGTDIVHMHPSFRGDRAGAASHLDFRVFARLVSRLEGGVFLNLGSAVIIPEVFLKALSLVRNLGHQVTRFTTIDMDFLRQYRPMTNVVERPTREGGKGVHLTGHHEIMFPLLAAAVIERLEDHDPGPGRAGS